MIHARPLSVPSPHLHMLGSSSLTRVFRVCKTFLDPLYVNVESITPDHHVVLQNDELSQHAHLGRTQFSLGTYQNKHMKARTRAIDLQHNLQNTTRTKFMINLSSINHIT